MATLDQAFTDHPPIGDVSPASGTAFSSVARTATPAPAIFSAPEDTDGLIVVIDVTAVSGSSSVVFTIEGVDRASGKTWVILASAAKVASATTVLRVSPNIAASANLIAQDMVPSEFIIRAAHGTADSTTYSVGVHTTS